MNGAVRTTDIIGQGIDPDVSVIIPVFGRHAQVCEAIRSALDQSDVRLEVLVVDDGSYPPIDLSSFADNRLRLIRHEVNRGAASARNTGLAASKGRFVAFLDSDDTWFPTKLAQQLSVAVATTESALIVVATGYRYSDSGTPGKVAMMPGDARGIAKFSGGIWFGPGSTALIPRQAFDIVGTQDEGLRRLEDYDWFLRFAIAGGELKVVKSTLATIAWRRHTDWTDIDRACEQLRVKYLLPTSGLAKRVRRRIWARLLLSRASTRWYAGKKVRALLLLTGSWLLAPRLHLLLVRPERHAA